MTKKFLTPIALVAVGLGLTACGQKAPRASAPAAHDVTATPQVIHYLCNGTKAIAVRYDESQDAVELYLGTVGLQLKHVASADGARFSDGLTTFWDKGKTATLELGASPEPMHCVPQDAPPAPSSPSPSPASPSPAPAAK